MFVFNQQINCSVDLSIRVHDVYDADIGSVIRVSSVGIGRRKKHVSFSVEFLNASPRELDLKVNSQAPIVEEGEHFVDADVDYLPGSDQI